MKSQVLAALICGALIASGVTTAVKTPSVAHAQGGSPVNPNFLMCKTGLAIPSGYVVTAEYPHSASDYCTDGNGTSYPTLGLTKISPNTTSVRVVANLCADQPMPSGAVILGWQQSNACTAATTPNPVNIIIIALYE